MLDQSGVAAGDACRKSGLPKVLARESRGPHISGWKVLYLADVAAESQVWKSRREHCLGVGIDFTQEYTPVTGALHPELDSRNARE